MTNWCSPLNDIARPIYDDPLFAWAPQPACKPSTPVAQDAGPAAPTAVPDSPPDVEAIWAVLANHRGQAAAITAPAIAAAAGLWQDLAPVNAGTKVRKLLELTQDAWPFPICGDVDGYYVAVSADELTHYCANLRSRALCCLRRFASVRRAGRRAGFPYLGRGRWADPDAPRKIATS